MSLSKSIFKRSENKFNEKFKGANRKSWLIKIALIKVVEVRLMKHEENL